MKFKKYTKLFSKLDYKNNYTFIKEDITDTNFNYKLSKSYVLNMSFIIKYIDFFLSVNKNPLTNLKFVLIFLYKRLIIFAFS